MKTGLLTGRLDTSMSVRVVGLAIIATLALVAGSILWQTINYAMHDGWRSLAPFFGGVRWIQALKLMGYLTAYLFLSLCLVALVHAIRHDLTRATRWIDLGLRFLAGLPMVLLVSVAMAPLAGISDPAWFRTMIALMVLALASVPTGVVILAETEAEDAPALAAARNLGLSRRFIFWEIQLRHNRRRLWLAVAVGACRTLAEFTLIVNVAGRTTGGSDDFLSTAGAIAQNVHVKDNMLLIVLILAFSLVGRGIMVLAAAGGRQG